MSFWSLKELQVWAYSWAAAAILNHAMAERGIRNYKLERPRTVRFNVRYLDDVTSQEVLNAVERELKEDAEVKCIAPLNKGWFNITFARERQCVEVARRGLLLQNTRVACERANVMNSIVVYVKAPYEMPDAVILGALSEYGAAGNVRRLVHDFNGDIENGVRSVLVRNVKKPIPSFLRVGGFSLPVRHRGQEKTCKICNEPGHFARDCQYKGRCFVCGSEEHRATWNDNQGAEPDGRHQRDERDDTDSESEQEGEDDGRHQRDELDDTDSESEQEGKDDGSRERTPDDDTVVPGDDSGKQPQPDAAAPRKPQGFWDEANMGASRPQGTARQEEDGRDGDESGARAMDTDETAAVQGRPVEIGVETAKTDRTKGNSQETEEEDMSETEGKEDGWEYVTYNRGGRQLLRKKRTSWERKPKGPTQSNTCKPGPKTSAMHRASSAKESSKFRQPEHRIRGGRVGRPRLSGSGQFNSTEVVAQYNKEIQTKPGSSTGQQGATAHREPVQSTPVTDAFSDNQSTSTGMVIDDSSSRSSNQHPHLSWAERCALEWPTDKSRGKQPPQNSQSSSTGQSATMLVPDSQSSQESQRSEGSQLSTSLLPKSFIAMGRGRGKPREKWNNLILPSSCV